jgi:protein SCO1
MHRQLRFHTQHLLVAAALVWTAACGTSRDASNAASPFRGVALTAPIQKPSLTLTDFNGKPFDLVRETQGKVALLFFGYTHCPDVCPLHMANIAAVLNKMPWEERSNIRVVFVTTDPERDSPQRLKEWLANFDPTFIGLTGSKDELARAQQSLGLPPAQREYASGDTSTYYLGHAAQVYAFARDGFAYLVYPFGIRQEDWANDLPKLARDSSGEELRRELAAAARTGQLNVMPAPETPNVTMGGLVVTQAVIAQPPSLTEAALYLTIKNDTPQSDTLVAVATDVATRAEMHESAASGGMRGMTAIRAIPLPPHSETRLAPGARHVMLLNLRRKLVAGDTATLFISLVRAGAIQATAKVVRYDELEKTLK